MTWKATKRRTILKTIGAATVAGGAFAGISSAQERERYDPLPNEAGLFLGPAGPEDSRYVGPPQNEQEHIEMGCDDVDAPSWFCEQFCAPRDKCSGKKKVR